MIVRDNMYGVIKQHEPKHVVKGFDQADKLNEPSKILIYRCPHDEPPNRGELPKSIKQVSE